MTAINHVFRPMALAASIPHFFSFFFFVFFFFFFYVASRVSAVKDNDGCNNDPRSLSEKALPAQTLRVISSLSASDTA